MKHYKLLISAGLLACWSMAFAGTTITFAEESGGRATENTVIYITEDHVRMDTAQGRSYVLFDPATDTLTLVRPAVKRYMVLDRARLASINRMMKRARARLERTLAHLPPARRERVREMISKRFGVMMEDGSKVEPEVVRTGKEKTVAGYSCEVVKVRIGTIAGGTYCLASWTELGIPEANYRSLRDMMEFYKLITEQFARQFASAGLMAKLLGLGGLPIESHRSKKSGTVTSSTLAGLEVGPISADLFTIPAGYEQRTLASMSKR